jgi:hypothetical protein
MAGMLSSFAHCQDDDQVCGHWLRERHLLDNFVQGLYFAIRSESDPATRLQRVFSGLNERGQD